MNFCLWITGLPGSGKTAIARELETMMARSGPAPAVLRLDELRKIMTPQPRYTEEEREVVYRALVLMAQQLVRHSEKPVLIDATGNRRRFRDLARELIAEFAEVYVSCPLAIARMREGGRKGGPVEEDLYEKAERGALKGRLPGVSSPYEEPERPEITVPSDHLTPRESAEKIMEYVETRWG